MTQSDQTPASEKAAVWWELAHIYLAFFAGTRTTGKEFARFRKNTEANLGPLRDLSAIVEAIGLSSMLSKIAATALLAAAIFAVPYLSLLVISALLAGTGMILAIISFSSTALLLLFIRYIAGSMHWIEIIALAFFCLFMLYVTIQFQRLDVKGAEQHASGFEINVARRCGAKLLFAALALYLGTATIYARLRRICSEKVPASSSPLPIGVDDDPEWECEKCQTGARGRFHQWPRLSQPLTVLCPECAHPHPTVHVPPLGRRSTQGAAGHRTGGNGGQTRRVLFLPLAQAALPPQIAGRLLDGRRLELPSCGAGSRPPTVEVEIRTMAAGRFWSGSYDAVVVVPPDTRPSNRLAHEENDLDLAWSLVEAPPRTVPAASRSFAYKGVAWLDQKLMEIGPLKRWWLRWR